jgi:hypothetical protein
MSKIFWKALLASPAVFGAALAISGNAMAAQTNEASPAGVDSLEAVAFPEEAPTVTASESSVQLAQVTSVSELSDVLPTDWAFTALQRLVEEYGCIEGYPDRTFRGNRAMTRFEFAAGLNACLDVVVGLIGDDGDLATIRRLQDEFSAELATLRGRVDALEVDVAELQANQFSTTTVLNGQVDFNLVSPFDRVEDDGDVEVATSFNARARLNFDTSFTGEDRLRTRIQGGNDGGALLAAGGLANSAGRDSSGQDFNARVSQLAYTFPISERIGLALAATGYGPDDFVVSTIVPFDGPSVADPGFPQGYGFDMGGGAGLGVNVALSDNLFFDAGYTTSSSSTSGSGSPLRGVSGSDAQSFIAQVSFLSDGLLDLGLAFLRGNSGTFDGDGISTSPAGNVFTNTYMALANLDFGRFEVGGHYAYHTADTPDLNTDSFQIGVALNDLGAEGNQLGIYYAGLPAYGGAPWMVEGYYAIGVNEFITVTPALIYGDLNSGFPVGPANDNDNSFYGALRTTFSF